MTVEAYKTILSQADKIAELELIRDDNIDIFIHYF